LSGAPGNWVLSIRAQPGAARSAPAGEHGGCLRVRIEHGGTRAVPR
jgi:hypothetical protein